jgi:hypothetical protein
MTSERKAAFARLQDLANFLRRGVAEGYKPVGLLLSHEHYDHTDDIGRFYELLTGSNGEFRSHERLDFWLTGQPLADGDLPTIYCDADTRDYLTRKVGFPGSHPRFHQIRRNGKQLTYDDKKNKKIKDDGGQPCRAGIPADPFVCGSFQIEPWIWDHMNVLPGWKWEAAKRMSGSLQRQTAFLLYHRSAKNARRTFIGGSAGEMSDEFTGKGLVAHPSEPIRADFMVQSIPGSCEATVKALIDYQLRHFEIQDTIVCSHFDDFLGVLGGESSTYEYTNDSWRGDFHSVQVYVEELCRRRSRHYPESGESVARKVHVLRRIGIDEVGIPACPSQFRESPNGDRRIPPAPMSAADKVWDIVLPQGEVSDLRRPAEITRMPKIPIPPRIPASVPGAGKGLPTGMPKF